MLEFMIVTRLTVSLRESIADPAARPAGDTMLSGWLTRVVIQMIFTFACRE